MKGLVGRVGPPGDMGETGMKGIKGTTVGKITCNNYNTYIHVIGPQRN